jgi:DNA-binding transcriptional regulator YbjK
MSNNYWDDEDDDLDNDTDTQMDGSDLLKKLRKAKRADEKRIKELTEQLETFTKTQRESTVKAILEQKGVNQKAARLVLKDLEGDFSEEAVSNWLNENGELFGLEVSESRNEQNLATLRQQDVMTTKGFTPDRAQDLEQRMDNAGSMEELLTLMQSQQ